MSWQRALHSPSPNDDCPFVAHIASHEINLAGIRVLFYPVEMADIPGRSVSIEPQQLRPDCGPYLSIYTQWPGRHWCRQHGWH